MDMNMKSYICELKIQKRTIDDNLIIDTRLCGVENSYISIFYVRISCVLPFLHLFHQCKFVCASTLNE